MRDAKKSRAHRISNRELLFAILRGLIRMSMHLDQLRASVARNTDVTASAATMIRGLAEQIRNATDPAEVAAIAAEIEASADALAAAVAENTVVEPESSAQDSQFAQF